MDFRQLGVRHQAPGTSRWLSVQDMFATETTTQEKCTWGHAESPPIQFQPDDYIVLASSFAAQSLVTVATVLNALPLNTAVPCLCAANLISHYSQRLAHHGPTEESTQQGSRAPGFDLFQRRHTRPLWAESESGTDPCPRRRS